MKTQLHFRNVASATWIARRARRMRAMFFNLALLLAVFSTGRAQAQTGVPNTAWYNTTATSFSISNADQLAGLAQIVNGTAEGITRDDFAGKTITLANNITLSAYGASFNGGRGWIPIGSNTTFKGKFNGNNQKITDLYMNSSVQYKGFFGWIETPAEIYSLGIEAADITCAGSYSGGIAGFVQDASITNCYFTGKIKGSSYTGGIAGVVQGQGSSITNCYVAGTISGLAISTQGDIGGITGSLSNGGSIANCYANVKVFGYQRVGGIAGRVTGDISNCYSTGYVIGYQGSFGGIAGSVFANSNVTNCYSTSGISGVNSLCGGIAGSSQGTVQNCIALNPNIVGSINNLGRVLGYNDKNAGGIVTDAFAFAGMTSYVGPAFSGEDDRDGTGKPAEAFQTASGFPDVFTKTPWTYTPGRLPGLFGNTVDMPAHLQSSFVPATNLTGTVPSVANAGTPLTLDANLTVEPATATFKTIEWVVVNGSPTGETITGNTLIAATAGTVILTAVVGDGYLAKNYTITVINYYFAGGEGTSDKPYQIATAEQLERLARFVNDRNPAYNKAYYKLTADIDLSTYGINFNGGAGWRPIGDPAGGYSNSFMGNFDGNNHIIRGLYINSTTANSVGLFGYIANAEIKNLGVLDANITSRADYWVGIIAGHLQPGVITNCFTSGTVNCTGGNVGGIAGNVVNGSRISNCYSTATVSGANFSVGGITGAVNSSIVENCAALNPSAPTYRVANTEASSTLSGNFAFSGMRNSAGQLFTTELTHDGRNGESKTVEQLQTEDGFPEVFINQSPWKYQPGKLPGLGEAMDMPAHLILIVPVTSITVSGAGGATAITTNGGTLQMEANVLPTNATNREVTWSVISETGSATISANGLLTATGNGTVLVKATAKDGSGKFGELRITISGQTQVNVAPGINGPTTHTLTEGYAATSTTVYTITGAPAPMVTKTSGDTKITWNNDTKKLDIAAGLAAREYPVVLTASNGVAPEATLTFTLMVSAAFVPVTGITGIPTTATAGVDLTLTGVVAPTTATNQTIVWSKSAADDGSAGASVAGNTLTTTKAGTAKVTATIVNGLTASTNYTKDFTITVNALVNAATPNITVQPRSASYYLKNATATPLSVTATVTDVGTLSYEWFSNTANSTTGGMSVGVGNTCTPNTTSAGTLYYYVEVTNTNNTVNGAQTAKIKSETAVVHVITGTGKITGKFNGGSGSSSGKAVRLGWKTGSGKSGSGIKYSETIGVKASLPEDYVLIATTVTDADGNYKFENLPEGVYMVLIEIDGFTSTPSAPITLGNGETKSDVNFKVEGNTVVPGDITGVGEIFAPNLKIYPNPFTDAVRITGIGETGEIGKTGETLLLRVINAVGVVVYTQMITNPDEIIRLEQLPAGVYFFTIESDGQSKTVKVVKN